jgi:signal transduction histidine kinase/ligand-binding sensor domain-containing protein/CheY-like chemotaxis protein
MMISRGYIIYLISLLGLTTISSVEGAMLDQQMRFDRITVHDGLSNQTVRCIIQDHEGFMWFGTNSGLNRFDGNKMVKFYNRTNGFRGSIIHCMHEDSRRNLWIGTFGNGLNLYNRNTNTFTNYVNDPNDESSISSNEIWYIYEDSKGNLWVAGQGGLQRYDYATDSFEKHLEDFKLPQHSINMRHTAFSSIVEAGDGILWIGTWKYGVILYDAAERRIVRHLMHEPDNVNSLSTNEILTLYRDKEDNIWIGTYKGALECVQFRYGSIFFKKYHKGESSYNLSDDRIHFIQQDQSDIYWIGTEHGLNLLDTKTGLIRKIYHNLDERFSLSSNHIWSGFRNSNGVMWIGLHDAGINTYDVWRQRFTNGYKEVSKAKEHKKRFVKSIFVDPDDFVWIGTDHGLNKFSNDGVHIKTYVSGDASTGLSIGGVTGILIDWNNQMWVGTWGGGLHKFDRKEGKFKSYGFSSSTLDRHNLSDPNIRCMALDYSGHLLIGTTFGYLDIFNPKTEEFEHFPCMDVDSIVASPVVALCPEKDGSIWIGLSENGGVVNYNPSNGNIKRYHFSERDTSATLSSNDVLCLFNDDKWLWIGTKDGLNLLNKEDGSVTIFNEEDGLPDRSILRIEKDVAGNLWISTTKGITKYEISSGKFFSYDHRDGVLGNCITSWAGTNGTLLFGGIDGVFSFNPSEINNNPYLPPVVLTGFYIFNRLVVPEEKGSPLQHQVNQTDIITLRHDQTSFSFEFAALNFTLPERTQYRYMLEGFDNDWVYSGLRREAFYTNVIPGVYNFKVLGSNNDGIWNPSPKIITIKVLPAPWKTTWAYSLYFILILLLLAVMRGFMLSREKLRTQLVFEKLEHERSLELSKKNSELNDMKIKFFTNISHEFRTPLTLILGPLGAIHKAIKETSIEDSVVMVQKNAQRMLRLINQLLDLSRIEAGFMKIEATHRDVVHFIKSVVDAFSMKAKTRCIRYEFDTNFEFAMGHFDDDKLESVLYNLLSNAFKFTPEGGQITVKLKIEPEPSKIDAPDKPVEAKSISITVTDTGPGIQDADKQKIFDYFYRPTDARSQPGSGLGLSLVNELVRILRGSIELLDNPTQNGSMFVVTIPVDKECYAPGELTEKRMDIDLACEDIALAEDALLKSNMLNLSYPVDIKKQFQPLVLIAEDNDEVRNYLSGSLSDGYRTIEASNGDSAINLAREEMPDLIISDVMMPGINGFELNKMLKDDERTCHIPVILLTAKTGMSSQMEGYKAGADDYIVKPFEMEHLICRVENLISSRRKLRETFSKRFDLDIEKMNLNSLDKKFLEDIIQLVEENIDDYDFGADQVVGKMPMSRAQVYRKLKSLTNLSVSDFIQKIRLYRAAKSIMMGDKSFSEISYLVGFKDPSYFTKCFKKQFECLPSEFNQKYYNSTNSPASAIQQADGFPDSIPG